MERNRVSREFLLARLSWVTDAPVPHLVLARRQTFLRQYDSYLILTRQDGRFKFTWLEDFPTPAMRHPGDDMREERLRQEGIELDGKSLGPTPSTGPVHPGRCRRRHHHRHHRSMAVIWGRPRHGELCGGHGGGLLQRPRESLLVRFVIDIEFLLFDLGKVAVNVFFVLVVAAAAVIVVAIAVVIMIAIVFVARRTRRLLQRSYSHVIRSSSSSIFDRLGGGAAAAVLGCFLPRLFGDGRSLGGTHAVVGDCIVRSTTAHVI